MDTQVNILKLEKERLKLFRQMIEYERKMENCHTKELSRFQFKYARACTKLIKIEKLIKTQYPNLTAELDNIDRINYNKLTKKKSF